MPGVPAGYSTEPDDGDRVVLEGLHAVKHAVRFGAAVAYLVTDDPDALSALATEVAPELQERLRRSAAVVDPAQFAALCRRPPGSPLLGIGPVLQVDAREVLRRRSGPVVVLEDPRHPGNAGAVIRVAAAAGAAAVLTSGSLDPWSRAVVRSAAGLHYALAVGRVDDAGPALIGDRQVLALDPDGSPLVADTVSADAVLVFGGERHGLSDAARERADQVCRLPMRPGVSSLNLATAVAATLYQLEPEGRR